MKKRITTVAAAVVASALALTGCSGQTGGGSDADARGKVTVRLWDENAAKVYESSLQAFHKSHPDIQVKIETVPWADYFANLRQDMAADEGPDMFWLNGANMTDYVSSNLIAPAKEVLGGDKSATFDPSVVKQYTQKKQLMGIPQITDGGIALYYNSDMLKNAGLSPEDLKGLKWSPDPSKDTLLPVLQKLTRDANGKDATQEGFDANKIVQYGYNASFDLQAMLLPYIGSAGGTFQNGDKFTYTNPKTVQAFEYLVDLIQKYHVAPPAEDTNPNGDYARDAFLRGKIALFQSGTYNLANVAKGVKWEWGIAPLPAGPAGAVTPAPGVVMVTNAKKAKNPAVQTYAKWIASSEANAYFAKEGAFIPAVKDAQGAFSEYWKNHGGKVAVDTFFVQKGQGVIAPAQGANWGQAEQAFRPILNEMFLGRTPVKEALKKANDAANAAVEQR